MKAEELMIGDWVLYNETHQQILEISCIDDEVYLKTDELVHLSEIQPIPLTTEILKKNGFDTSDPEVKQYHFTEDGQSYHFSLRQMYNQKDNKPNGYSFYAFCVLTIIDYVHQLQHALRLCGIEKDIVL